MRKNNKVLVIGIDGATFHIILPMIERGELPTFKSIMNKGTWAELMSTYPPHTVPAWVSCATGMNPGNLGVYDFRENSHLTYDEGRFVFSTDVKAKPLWSLLSEKNKKVMVVAIPMTNPPVQVNGVMVSPVRVIDHNKVKTYPPELSHELFNELKISSVLKKRMDYMEMHLSRVGSELEIFFDTVVSSSRQVIEKLTEAILYLFSKQEYDFSMVMLPIDALQHHLWCFMDKNHPSHNAELAAKYKNIIFEGYKWVDHALEKILNKVNDDTTIILVSDHGFGPLHKIFYQNRWLMEKGLLKLKRGGKHSFAVTRVPFGRFLQKMGIGFISRLLPERLNNARIPFVKRNLKPIPELIDWQQTKAYATSYAININLQGREPQGIVKPGEEYNSLVSYIKEELCKLKDPDNGQKIIERVVEKREIYNGPYVEAAPDILVFFKDPKFSIRKDLFYPHLFRQLSPEDRLTGHHTSFPKGICIMKGPHIVPGAVLKEPHIIDIAPTVLYLLGGTVPEGLDGRVLTEAMNQEYIESHPITTSKYSDAQQKSHIIGDQTLIDEDSEAIKRQLKELGYMG